MKLLNIKSPECYSWHRHFLLIPRIVKIYKNNKEAEEKWRDSDVVKTQLLWLEEIERCKYHLQPTEYRKILSNN